MTTLAAGVPFLSALASVWGRRRTGASGVAVLGDEEGSSLFPLSLPSVWKGGGDSSLPLSLASVGTRSVSGDDAVKRDGML